MPYLGKPITRAVIDEATAAQHEIIAAATGQKHHIFAIWIWSAGTVGVLPQTASTSLSGEINLVAQSLFKLDFNDNGEPWLVCAAGEAFNLTLDAAIQVSGVAYYVTA